ncbi:lyase family protein [Mongoliitalea lutea]|uniref:3-carboxy-cis,cis-muconate cycloisomerase n=1 Tax=Mongoliitalea lutea TaxID=849756 RepID=A0A8J3CY89_9BACT|nr:lyase family protein [Mongoliitalea lutea]GHB34524.1 3-carboxy-cis,cis-muconate cycloisomerase [Mongoliitalea lutea]
MIDRKIFRTYWGYPQVNSHVSDVSFIRAILTYESCLASCQSSLGIIPKEAAQAIHEAVNRVRVDDGLIQQVDSSTAENGIPTIAVVEAIKEQLDQSYHPFLHVGVTSQDLIDTAHMLALQQLTKDFRQVFSGNFQSLVKSWLEHSDWICIARTRQQQALPVTFGYKLYHWFAPLVDSLKILEQLRFPVSLGGPVGDMRAFGEQGKVLTEKLAEALGMDDFGAVWHQNRQPVLEIVNVYERILMQLRKILQDWIFLANSEIAELRLLSKGKSSAMAHKNNPVQLEQAMVLVSIALDSIQNYKNHAIFSSERDGVSWTLEWYYLSALDSQLQVAAHGFLKTMHLMEWQKEAMGRHASSFQHQLQEAALSKGFKEALLRLLLSEED